VVFSVAKRYNDQQIRFDFELMDSIQILEFLEKDGIDAQGRTIEEIWRWDDAQWESEHDFIQWLFPLNEQSMAVRNSPVLSADDIEQIRKSDVALSSLESSTARFQLFLSRSSHWVRSYDHNHLRITRVIKSLRLLAGDNAAGYFKEWLSKRLGHDVFSINEKSRKYWVDS